VSSVKQRPSMGASMAIFKAVNRALLLLDLEIGMDPGVHQVIQVYTGFHFAIVKCVALLFAPGN
jgi:hypothetical protein